MKTNFKKLFASILACISVVPSVNFKAAAIAEPSEIVNINTAQDWTDIRDRIRQDEHYTDGKYFVLNNDIILHQSNWRRRATWERLAGTLDGNGHTITITGNS